MVNKCPHNTYEGFNNFQEAKDWLLAQGHETFHFVVGCSDGPKSARACAQTEGDNDSYPGWYAVARGQAPGIYSTYRTAKLQVEGYPNAMFKSYATEEAARAALECSAADTLAQELSALRI